MIQPHSPARIGAGPLSHPGGHGFGHRRCRRTSCNMHRPICNSVFPRVFFHSVVANIGVFVTPVETSAGRTHDRTEPMRPSSLFAMGCKMREARGSVEEMKSLVKH